MINSIKKILGQLPYLKKLLPDLFHMCALKFHRIAHFFCSITNHKYSELITSIHQSARNFLAVVVYFVYIIFVSGSISCHIKS